MADDADAAGTVSTLSTEGMCATAADDGSPSSTEPEGVVLEPDSTARSRSCIRVATMLCIGMIVILAVVGGWLSTNALHAQRTQHRHAEFLDAGRQGALNLTSISYTDPDRAVRRILDSSVGAFHDDFQKRSGPFVDVVRKTQSTTRGTISEAAIESAQDDHAQVLIAVSVQTTSPTQPTPEVHLWRMRITLQAVGDSAKMSDVAFVS